MIDSNIMQVIKQWSSQSNILRAFDYMISKNILSPETTQAIGYLVWSDVVTKNCHNDYLDLNKSIVWLSTTAV